MSNTRLLLDPPSQPSLTHVNSATKIIPLLSSPLHHHFLSEGIQQSKLPHNQKITPTADEEEPRHTKFLLLLLLHIPLPPHLNSPFPRTGPTRPLVRIPQG